MKMSQVRLLVEDFDRCYDFYSETLGLKVTWGKKGDDYASFGVGEKLDIAIFKAELMQQFFNIEPRSLRDIPEKALLVLEYEDVDEIYERLTKLDIEFINEPMTMPGWGIRCVHLRDPEGNIIELNSLVEYVEN